MGAGSAADGAPESGTAVSSTSAWTAQDHLPEVLVTRIIRFRSSHGKLHHPRCQYVIPHMMIESSYATWDELYDAVIKHGFSLCKQCKPLKV